MTKRREPPAELPELPLKISVPVPSHIPRARGLYATNIFGANLKIRMSLDDKKLISKQAKRMGMKRAEFIRSCAILVAKELSKYAI